MDLTSTQTVGGAKTFSGTIGGNISGNASTVTNGVYTTGSYADPGWVQSLAWGKIAGTPTTAAGYGIADLPAAFATQSGAYPAAVNGTTANFTGTNAAGMTTTSSYSYGAGNRGSFSYCNASGSNTQCYGGLAVAQDSDSSGTGKHLVGFEADAWATSGLPTTTACSASWLTSKHPREITTDMAFGPSRPTRLDIQVLGTSASERQTVPPTLHFRRGLVVRAEPARRSKFAFPRWYREMIRIPCVYANPQGSLWFSLPSGATAYVPSLTVANGSLVVAPVSPDAGSGSNAVYLQYGNYLNTSLYSDGNGNIVLTPAAGKAVTSWGWGNFSGGLNVGSINIVNSSGTLQVNSPSATNFRGLLAGDAIGTQSATWS